MRDWQVPPPLAIVTVELEIGELCKGFVCEGYVGCAQAHLYVFAGMSSHDIRSTWYCSASCDDTATSGPYEDLQ